MKLQFEEIKNLEEDRKLLIFRNYLKPNFLNCELKIAIIGNKIDYLDFYSNRYGIARYDFSTRKFTANSWEKEDDVQGISELSKHYTSIYLNSNEDSIFAREKVIPDVQENADNLIIELIDKVINNSAGSISDFPFIQNFINK
ncbi:MAG: hypothetical protein GW938_17695 [Leptospira sp.]|jgi:hypothetical protein|nr:hypothetical protein [Leptospira sp.]